MSNHLIISEYELFPITDEPKNGNGDVLYILQSDSVEFIRQLLGNVIKRKMSPYLKETCGDHLTEDCVYTALIELPWPPIAQKAVLSELNKDGIIIFDPNLLHVYLLQNGFKEVEPSAPRLILRIVQWIAFLIYQSIYQYIINVAGKKQLISKLTTLEAIRENEILADILRNCAL